jgi:hypothetical protein
MGKKLKQSVDMKGFFKEVGGDHDAVLELVTNAIEAAKSRVDVNFDREKGILSVINDGKGLTEEEIETVLLRSFKTGSEKAKAESNRGLGFIVIYHDGKETTVRTGKYSIHIKSWDDIDLVEESNNFEGMSVQVKLNKEALKRYTIDVIYDTMDRWILTNGIELYLNGTLAGNYIKEKFEIKTYRDGLDYIVNNPIFRYDTFSCLLKLTNIDAYRVLPIEYDIFKHGQTKTLKRINIIITKGEHLNTARTALSYRADYYVKELIKKKDIELAKAAATDDIDITRRRLYSDIEFTLQEIAFVINAKPRIFKKAGKNFEKKFKNASFEEMIKEICYFNKFSNLINSSKSFNKVTQIREISLPLFLEFEAKDKSVYPSTFSYWFKETFGFDQKNIFLNERIGLMVNNGNISGEAIVKDLIKCERWVNLETELFQGNCLEDETLVIIFNEDAKFYTYISDWEADVSKLTSKNAVEIKTGEAGGDVAEFAVGEDQIKEGGSDEEVTETQPMSVEELRDATYDSGAFSCKAANGRAVHVDDLETFKMLVEAGIEKISGPENYCTDEYIESELEEDGAMFFISDEEEADDDEEVQEAIKAVEENNPLSDFLSKNIESEEEYKDVQTEIQLENITFEVLEIDGERIPSLIHEKGKQDFNYAQKYPGVKRNKKIIEAYKQWKGIIKLVMKHIPQIESRIVPVIGWSDTKADAASHVGRFVAINYRYLPNLSDMKLQKILKVLETAIHEITHTMYSKHSDPNFVTTYNTIWDTCIESRDFMKQLKKVF